jgi:electron transfer flavoprotein alpha subunit
MSQVIVLAEQKDGALVNATLAAIGAAKEIVAIVGGSFDIAVAGESVGPIAEQLAQYGAEKILILNDGLLGGYTAQAYARAFDALVRESGAKYVVAAATSIGKDMVPRLAARLGGGLASDVVSLEGSETDLVYVRPMWAGNVLGKVKVTTDIELVTVRGTEFDNAQNTGGASSIQVVTADLDPGSIRMSYVGLESVKSDRPDLSDANVVISGGRGLKAKENFAIVEALADQLNGAIGASRAVVDAGWVPNDWQVGQTGKVVAPGLYIAVGISGAIQHLAGMKGSKTIVAINKDPDAPIFQVADYGLVADLFEVVPELTEKLANR